MAGLNFLPASWASASRCVSRSSRNFRNMTHVSIGRRSKSPFRPLSFRIISLADLSNAPSDCAVVWIREAFTVYASLAFSLQPLAAFSLFFDAARGFEKRAEGLGGGLHAKDKV